MGEGGAEDETSRFDPADEIEGARIDRLFDQGLLRRRQRRQPKGE
jgi:hypothetical protein